VNVAGKIPQAERYAAGFKPADTMQPAWDFAGRTIAWPDGNEGHYQIPFVYSCNGRPYIKQLAEQSGTWFRDLREPCIAITVDLLTTGIDVPKICHLVFLRRVRSRILYEQINQSAALSIVVNRPRDLTREQLKQIHCCWIRSWAVTSTRYWRSWLRGAGRVQGDNLVPPA
jgi:type I site-specific restriction endonuclease